MTQVITLRSGLADTPHGFSYVRESVKLTVRALVHQQHTRSWLQLLNSNPILRELVASWPRLIHKIYRPYMSNTLRCQERLEVLKAHYQFILKQGLGSIVAQAAHGPLQLASLTGKTGARYAIQLRAISTLEREGELVLQLVSGASLIYSVAFSFFRANGRLAIGIGCLQGPQCNDGLERIREATRELHGLRPKNLMVRLVRQLGHDYECRDLILVGNQNRTIDYAARKGLVFADYDTFWKEIGAVRRTDGDFTLACEDLPAPVMADIASKKRSEVRKRHELLAHTLASMRARLNLASSANLPKAITPLHAAPSAPAPIPITSAACELAIAY